MRDRRARKEKGNGEDYYAVEQDHNGLWFVLNYNEFPVSPAFEREEEAERWMDRHV